MLLDFFEKEYAQRQSISFRLLLCFDIVWLSSVNCTVSMFEIRTMLATHTPWRDVSLFDFFFLPVSMSLSGFEFAFFIYSFFSCRFHHMRDDTIRAVFKYLRAKRKYLNISLDHNYRHFIWSTSRYIIYIYSFFFHLFRFLDIFLFFFHAHVRVTWRPSRKLNWKIKVKLKWI